MVKQVACGAKHAVAIGFRGDLWSWGSGDSGLLGDGQTDSLSTIPVLNQTLALTLIIQVAAGETHSAALDSAGTVWTWGDGSYGRLGHGDDITLLHPKRIASLPKCVQVAAGGFHTLVLDTQVRAF